MRDRAIELLDGGIESYLLGLYGLNLPIIKRRRKQETKYAPIMGMFGASVELLVKACLVQGKGIAAMYMNEDVSSKMYRSATDCVDELKKLIRNDDESIRFIWKDEEIKDTQKGVFLNYLDKFRLLQDLRANGLHAGIGCSRDVAVTIANDIFDFIQLLTCGRRLKAYLKNIPAPEAPIRDREIIIEDLHRRFNSQKNATEKTDILRSMYLVLPYVPDMKPDWIDNFEKIKVTAPTNNDMTYLVRTLQDAHSIYLLKNRGGKEGFPVRVENENPDALPIAIQNIKRTLNNIPDIFNNDVLTANTWLAQGRLSLPLDDFLIDLFALGLENAKIISNGNKLTAQQVWAFIVSAYSTQGTPRPCWELIRECDELDKLLDFLTRARKYGNGYYIRRADMLIHCVEAYKTGTPVIIDEKNDKEFISIKEFYTNNIEHPKENPITPQFLHKNPVSSRVASIISDYLSRTVGTGDAVERILSTTPLTQMDKRAATALMRMCVSIEDKNGLVAVLRSTDMKNTHSEARKQMFCVDILNNGLDIK